MIKRILTLLIIISILVPTGALVMAREYKATEICEELGILKGDASGITSSYLSKDTNRLQAAIMFLRIKGLEIEALSYVSMYNFEDASSVPWTGGRAILSYLKNHPELGWIGDAKGNFKPNETITVQAYYKVLLELLGYKQNEDFTWDQVMTFSALRGMKLGQLYGQLDNDLFARLTVEGLKATMKSGTLLIDSLVDLKMVDEAKAVELGLISFPANSYYEIEFEYSDLNKTLISDGVSQTSVTAVVRRKSDGAKMGIYGEMAFNLSVGQLSKSRAMIINGEATVIITSQAASQLITGDLSAQVIDANNETVFVGLVGEDSINYDPNEIIEDTNYYQVAVKEIYADTCDRLTITYTGPISASAYKAALINMAPGINDWKTLVKAGAGAGIFIDHYNVYIKDIKQVSSNKLTIILNTDSPGSVASYIDMIEIGWVPTQPLNYLRDNVSHILTMPADVGNLVSKDEGNTFFVNDTKKPELLSVAAVGKRQLVVYFSEALAENSVEMSSRGTQNVTRDVEFSFALQGTKHVFRINGNNLYLTESPMGATPNEIAFALANNLVLVNELYVGGYDEVAGEDHRNEVRIVLDQYSAMLSGSHDLFAHDITDWAGNTDSENEMIAKTIEFYVFE